MNLEEAELVAKALQEDGVNDLAMDIIMSEIYILKQQKKKYDIGANHFDSLEVCEDCGEETFVWKMAGGGECKNPDCNHAEICF